MTKPQRRRQNLWLDSEGGFIGAAWYWPTQIDAAPTAVLLVPGIAHEEQRMNGGLVALAEALASVGLPALLIDLHGCAQSAGRLDDSDIGTCWRADIRSAVRYMRDCGAARVIVVGARAGMLLAVDALRGELLAALVAWAPITDGRRYVRELKLMQRAPDGDGAPGAIAIAGFSIPATVTAHFATLDLARIALSGIGRVLVCDADQASSAPWLASLRAAGRLVEHRLSGNVAPWLFGPEDQPDLPHDDIAALTRWCRATHEAQSVTTTAPGPRRPDQRRAIEFTHRGRKVRETFVEVGPHRMTGVLSEPADTPTGDAARLLMTTAGPGRMFTEFARDEASRGNVSLRFDFAGFGTSGRGEIAQGGRYYADCGADDVQAAITFLREAGHRRIYAFGFCAGAWAMLMADVAPELRAVAAINVALYREPGPTRPRSLATARRMRWPAAFRHHPLLRQAVKRMRRLGERASRPVKWLLRLCEADVRVMLAYAQDDPGLDYLKRQMRRGVHARLRGTFVVRTYEGLDHLVGGTAARARLFDDITAFFANVDQEAHELEQRFPNPHNETMSIPAMRPGIETHQPAAHRSRQHKPAQPAF